jgi:uncharacterized protein
MRRWTTRSSLLVAAAVWAFAAAANAASFDCADASTAAERLVCDDPLLSLSDEWLAKVYQSALERSANANALRRQQRRWVAERRGRCTDRPCLRDAYAARIAELVTSDRALYPAADLANCLIVADHAGRGELERLELAAGPEPSSDRFKELFAEEAQTWIEAHGYRYWTIELNGDRTPDHLVITVAGSMREGSAYVRSGRKNAAVQTLIDDDGGIDLRVLKVGSRHYILSAYEEVPSKLWRLEGDDLVTVCGFRTQPQPLVEMILGEGDPVCAAQSHSERQYAQFALMHGLGILADQERFWSKHPLDGLEQVDIDNDGHPDNLVRIDFVHGGGRGCGARYLAVTDETRTSIPDTRLNRLLLDEMGGHPCGPNLNAFTYGGTAFVEADHGGGTLAVHEVRHGEAKPRCKFRGRWIYGIDALDLDLETGR